MPQSLVKFYVHIIFSTKNRRPLINEQIENALYSYLGGICNGLECFPLKIGGHKDHVHILSHFSKKITLIKFLEELKSHSSNWIKTQDVRYKDVNLIFRPFRAPTRHNRLTQGEELPLLTLG